MLVFLNGRFVPDHEAVVPVTDRGFLYGDGLFETVRVRRGCAVRLADHLERLARGAAALALKLPWAPENVAQHAAELIARNQLPEAILRITVSRGSGARGYSPRGADQPTFVMTLDSAPSLDPGAPCAWSLVTAPHRISVDDALSGFKTANKLRNVMARMAAEACGANEALLLNTRGEVAEAASANVFWIQDGRIGTPPLSAGILPGITRAVILEICGSLGSPRGEATIQPDDLARAEGIFLTQSTLGVIAVTALDGVAIPVPPVIAQLHRAYWEA